MAQVTPEYITREEYEDHHKRLLYAFIIMTVVIVMGLGVILAAYANIQNERCTDMQQRQQAVAPALTALYQAQLADGDSRTAAVWKQYLDEAAAHPSAPC